MGKCLIVGLGNRGEKYQRSRHNVGHWLIDYLRQVFDFSRSNTYLFKTSVFMNSSGSEVKALVDKCRVPLNNLIVVHDDMDIEIGEFRLQFGRGAAGHKGVESVIKALGGKGFWRLRIGIGRPPKGVEAEDYVLRNFCKEEIGILKGLLPKIRRRLVKWRFEIQNAESKIAA
ncbi:aminoacyl-tRNA hydrolase [candidate division CPR3 bacterium 4484_211]|uniref:Aminoacyl-tRNA hydrolase n=1 Tax=candidate division CPR3 bacterium 4484_211 TaxID=1968527 RepID=A0A1W9NYI3_UNCC3|nr:MAG: aminoacyl-tRNA hydrolase [candidate division CPR3 bacterium 4484_211]